MNNCARPPLVFSLLLLVLALILSACGGGQSNVDQGNRNGTLHWGNGTEPQSLDPHIATGVPEHHIITALMEGLMSKDSKTLAPKAGVAGVSTPLNYARLPAGLTATRTMPMIMSGPGGAHCNQR